VTQIGLLEYFFMKEGLDGVLLQDLWPSK